MKFIRFLSLTLAAIIIVCCSPQIAGAKNSLAGINEVASSHLKNDAVFLTSTPLQGGQNKTRQGDFAMIVRVKRNPIQSVAVKKELPLHPHKVTALPPPFSVQNNSKVTIAATMSKTTPAINSTLGLNSFTLNCLMINLNKNYS